MEKLDISRVDFDDPAESAAVVEIINSYAIEPQGGGVSLSEDVQARIIPGMKATPGAFTLLASKNGKPVGVAVCFRGFSTFAGKPLVNVHDLSVIKEFRGQRIGTRLLEAVEKLAAAEGCSKVTLEVREINPVAERLYRRLGYSDPSGYATRFLDKPLSAEQ